MSNKKYRIEKRNLKNGKIKIVVRSAGKDKKYIESKTVAKKDVKETIKGYYSRKSFKKSISTNFRKNRYETWDYSDKPKARSEDTQYKVGVIYKGQWVYGWSSFDSDDKERDAYNNLYNKLSVSVIGFSDTATGREIYNTGKDSGAISRVRAGIVSHGDL